MGDPVLLFFFNTINMEIGTMAAFCTKTLNTYKTQNLGPLPFFFYMWMQ